MSRIYFPQIEFLEPGCTGTGTLCSISAPNCCSPTAACQIASGSFTGRVYYRCEEPKVVEEPTTEAPKVSCAPCFSSYWNLFLKKVFRSWITLKPIWCLYQKCDRVFLIYFDGSLVKNDIKSEGHPIIFLANAMEIPSFELV